MVPHQGQSYLTLCFPCEENDQTMKTHANIPKIRNVNQFNSFKPGVPFMGHRQTA